MANNNTKSINVPSPSQQDGTGNIGAGHGAATQVLPGGKVANTSLSATGQMYASLPNPKR